MKRRTSHSANVARRQQGVVLIMGLIILLVMTMLGVIAIRSSTQQGAMAGSYQQQAQSFQGAESAIRLVMAQLNDLPGRNLSGTARNLDLASFVIEKNVVLTSATGSPEITPVPSGAYQIVASSSSAGGSGFDSRANFYSTGICGDGTSPCPMPVGSSMGKYSAFSFEANALSTQPRTFARTNNIEGVTMLAPKQ